MKVKKLSEHEGVGKKERVDVVESVDDDARTASEAAGS